MVRIISHKKSTSNDGKEFISLKVQGGIEPVQSMHSGKMYLTAKTAYVPSTFDEQTAQALIGTDIPGKVVKVPSDPYDYTIKETGETITLLHRYEFQMEDIPAPTSLPIASEQVHDLMEIQAEPV